MHPAISLTVVVVGTDEDITGDGMATDDVVAGNGNDIGFSAVAVGGLKDTDKYKKGVTVKGTYKVIMKDFATPKYTTADEIRKARKLLGLTQREFARLVGSSTPTVERWEASQKEITGPIVLLISRILDAPEEFKHYFLSERTAPLRLKYMFRQHLCTIIDVYENNRTVKIKNYTSKVQFRAFGNEEAPTYEAFCEFLKSRCFPASRDKMKLVLEDLQLPFYAPPYDY